MLPSNGSSESSAPACIMINPVAAGTSELNTSDSSAPAHINSEAAGMSELNPLNHSFPVFISKMALEAGNVEFPEYRDDIPFESVREYEPGAKCITFRTRPRINRHEILHLS